MHIFNSTHATLEESLHMVTEKKIHNFFLDSFKCLYMHYRLSHAELKIWICQLPKKAQNGTLSPTKFEAVSLNLFLFLKSLIMKRKIIV